MFIQLGKCVQDTCTVCRSSQLVCSQWWYVKKQSEPSVSSMAKVDFALHTIPCCLMTFTFLLAKVASFNAFFGW